MHRGGQNMTTHILGIDPGLSGGLVLLNKQTRELTTTPMLTLKRKDKTVLAYTELAYFFNCYASLIHHAYIEQVSSRPRQAGVLLMGMNVGIIHGLMYAYDIPFTVVSPKDWKFHFALKRLDESYRDKKNDSRALAAKLFPNHAKAFSRVKDDGVAEAALIALYGLNKGKK